jgi:HK97 family phage portal protein
VFPSAWSGYPDEWWPTWGPVQALTGTAWTAVDLNSSLLATMPPYLVGNDDVDHGWIDNPDPDLYTSWEEFAKRLFWDYQTGEVFVMPTARYATGWPARFHVVEPWRVELELDPSGRRLYTIGKLDVTAEILHIRYSSTAIGLHGIGPLDVGSTKLIAEQILNRYALGFISAGAVPPSILTHPETLEPDQVDELKKEWLEARTGGPGQTAVLHGGITYQAVGINPRDMALADLKQMTGADIAVMFGVPPYLLGLESGSRHSLTYTNASGLFSYHWRAGLRPKAQAVMAALSGWLLPRGTVVELNRDAYIQPEPYERAQTYQILSSIKDPQGNPVISVEEIRAAERLDEGALEQ